MTTPETLERAAKSDRYLDGQHAVVTGGSRGIGAAIARALAERGAKVTLMSRSIDDLRKTADALRSDLATARCWS